jgi:hypothetical protein
MSLLTIVQQHCRVNGLPIPGFVVSSPDSTVQQYLGILNELVESMIDESKFQAFTEEGTWTYLPQEDQGDINDIAPNGFLWFHNETFYDRTLRRPLYGPISDTDWQALKAIPNPGPFYKYRIRGNRLLINPVPTAPLSLIAFEYGSSYGVISSSGVKKATFTADDDEFRLPERILQRGLKYRWKQEKGLPYQADETAYYSLLNNAIARDATKARHDLAHPRPFDIRPGIFVPSGNWPV